MECLFRRNWHTSVRRETGEQLVGETSYVDTNREVLARLRVGLTDFCIREAEWEEQRPVSAGAKKKHSLPILRGRDAYFNAAPALRELASTTDDPLLVPLVAETVKGFIQAETFLWEERGCSSTEEYDRKWAEAYRDSCRYYSNLDRVTQDWFQHVGETRRDEGNLFVRFKTQTLYGLGDDAFLLSGNLTDSFHGISVSIFLDRELKVEKAEGVLLRAPDSICKESTRFLEDLAGVQIKDLSKKQLATLLGKGQGCVHLIDLTFDAAQVLHSIGDTSVTALLEKWRRSSSGGSGWSSTPRTKPSRRSNKEASTS